ncbi:MAG TPA: hypothetical protein PKA63_02550 [Oligoflexia bacterium]|nr:hypothetical protein [Oligoflexia bacterium]HMP47532.1 hypothetical protein [Oligoflexia bacterium]
MFAIIYRYQFYIILNKFTGASGALKSALCSAFLFIFVVSEVIAEGFGDLAGESESLEHPLQDYLMSFRSIPGKDSVQHGMLCEKQIPASNLEDDFVPVHDRWSMFYRGKWYDPYHQNRFKGDLPVFGTPGHEWFLEVELVSLSLIEQRNLPTPVGVSSTRNPDTTDVFGDFSQLLAEENLIVQMSLIRGNTVFKPQDIELRVAPIFSFNHVDVNETGFLRADPVRGTTRNDQHVGFRELFADIHLGDLNDRYDFYSSRIGIQRFNADFRGFVFFDEAPGTRLFGTLDNNKFQWNLAWFSRLDKDSNALQNKIFDSRDEEVFLANLYRQDLFFLGHTVQGVVIHREDRAGRNPPDYDDNNFIVRPASIGDERPKNIYNTYLGLNSEGHVGPFNLSTSYYYTFGTETHNPIAGQRTSISAHMAQMELSYDFNWLRLRGSFFWASGDDDPFDGKARGFDSIVDNPQFAGGDTSYWQRQGIPFIAGGGVALVNRFSLLPDLRAGKEQGQSNFVNPGLFLYNIGVDVAATPKLQLTSNVSMLYFDRTEVVEALRQDGSIDSRIGVDTSVGLLYRPFLNNNVQVRAAVGALLPGQGLRNLYGSEPLYHGFTNLILIY